MTTTVYLACAYSHPDPKVRRDRYITVTLAATDLMRLGYVVISPVTMGHGYAMADPSIPTAYGHHRTLCEALMRSCDLMAVLEDDSVLASEGVRQEVAFFQTLARPVLWAVPDGARALTLTPFHGFSDRRLAS